MKTAKTLAFITSLALAAGCSYPNREVSYSRAASVYDYEAANRSLETAVRAELNRYGDLADVSRNINVRADSGAVTLTGAVANQQQKEMIDALVRNTSGVTSLNDEMQVSFAPTGVYNQPARVYSVPPATEAAPPPPVTVPAPVTSVDGAPRTTVQATTESDRFLAQDIIHSLRSDGLEPTIPRTVSIIVTEGRVDLRGTVQSEREHDAIVDSVRRTPGVNIVYDGLQVR